MNDIGAEPDRELFGLVHRLLPRPRSADCSGIVWQGNKRFSVTKAFSHADHQQLALSFTSHLTHTYVGNALFHVSVKDKVCIKDSYWDNLSTLYSVCCVTFISCLFISGLAQL